MKYKISVWIDNALGEPITFKMDRENEIEMLRHVTDIGIHGFCHKPTRTSYPPSRIYEITWEEL